MDDGANVCGGLRSFFLSLSRLHAAVQVALKEFQSLVDGLRLLHDQRPPQELYTVVQEKAAASPPAASGTGTGTGAAPGTAPAAPTLPGDTSAGVGRWVEEPLAEWPSPLYPFLLVSFGSGVSILQVGYLRE